MADTATSSAPTSALGSAPASAPASVADEAAADLAPAAERGTLDIRTKALEHLAESAALQAPGTVRRQGSLGGLVGGIVGGGSPRATVTMDGSSARVEIDVAATWPCAAAVIATDVRDRLFAEAARLSGIPVRTVDVTLHLVEPDESDDSPRRRVR